MRKLLLTAVVAALAAAGAVAAVYLWTPSGEQPAAADEQPHRTVVRAVMAEDRLWLLGRDGSLASLTREARQPEMIAAPDRVADICGLDGRLIAVTHDERGQRWLLRSHTRSEWHQEADVLTGGDTLVALSCENGRITLVTNRRSIEAAGGQVRNVRLSEDIGTPLVSATAFAGDDFVWVGFNDGEWGGGLMRIDRMTGAVETIERNSSGEICGGPLNSRCDPVTGIVASPWQPSCVVAAIGLAHIGTHGRIVQVCGREIQRLYFKPSDSQPPRGTLVEGEPSSTVAFYGLARSSDALWSVGSDGVYRLSGGRAEFIRLPEFQNRGGFRVSFDVPGVALVLTDDNQRAAVPITAVR